jgi:DNA-binding NarL/FixJ family response regulator
LIAQGQPLKQIAASLNVSARTVETYKTRAMEKLGLNTRADIIRFAVERGWLSA